MTPESLLVCDLEGGRLAGDRQMTPDEIERLLRALKRHGITAKISLLDD